MTYLEKKVVADFGQLIDPKNLQVLFAKIAYNPNFVDFFKFQKEVRVICPTQRKVFAAKICHDNLERNYHLYPQKTFLDLAPGDLLLVNFPNKGYNFVAQALVMGQDINKIVVKSIDPRYHIRVDLSVDVSMSIIPPGVINKLVSGEIEMVRRYLPASKFAQQKDGYLVREMFRLVGEEGKFFAEEDLTPGEQAIQGRIKDVSVGGFCIHTPWSNYQLIKGHRLVYLVAKFQRKRRIWQTGILGVIRNLRHISSSANQLICHTMFVEGLQEDILKNICLVEDKEIKILKKPGSEDRSEQKRKQSDKKAV